MANSLDEAEAMIEATDEAGVVFMIAFVLRYRREFMLLHDICRQWANSGKSTRRTRRHR